MREKNRQRKTQKRVKRKIAKIETMLSDEAVRNEKNEFLEKFMVCEVACKAIISDYNKEKGKKYSSSRHKTQHDSYSCGF